MTLRPGWNGPCPESKSLGVRIGIIAIVLCLEGIGIAMDIRGVPATVALDSIHGAQGWLFRFLIAYAASLAILILASRRDLLSRYASSDTRIRAPWLIAHAILIVLLLALSRFAKDLPSAFILMSALARPLLACGAGLALFAALAPAGVWSNLVRREGKLFAYAFMMAAAGVAAIGVSHAFWARFARLTFSLVRILLEPFYRHLHVDADSLTLATDRFGIVVTDYCSGLEGVGLMLVFCSAWLWYFRRDYRFPRALLIVPIAALVIFLLNAVRIAALLAIGDAGHADIASAGFHSQAGWIVFNACALTMAIVFKRSRWLMSESALERSTSSGAQVASAGSANPVLPYLMPLTVILAIGMLTNALSSGFDRFYPLRLAGCAVALWIYHKSYRRLDWRFSQRAVWCGTLLFAAWVLAARFIVASRSLPNSLSQLPAWSRFGWIGARAVAAVITVPLAEELAYRGYLMRRLTRADFESVPFRDVRWPALLITAAAFGAVHGSLWGPGILAGLVFGGLAIHTGKFGESVAAHAVTNALLAAYVLVFDQWQLW
jgi:exosortase E/protease (VPEID-CTERM system)